MIREEKIQWTVESATDRLEALGCKHNDHCWIMPRNFNPSAQDLSAIGFLIAHGAGLFTVTYAI